MIFDLSQFLGFLLVLPLTLAGVARRGVVAFGLLHGFSSVELSKPFGLQYRLAMKRCLSPLAAFSGLLGRFPGPPYPLPFSGPFSRSWRVLALAPIGSAVILRSHDARARACVIGRPGYVFLPR